MKKVGILTMYYRSENYGGILQAYALTEYLNKNGFDAEQICYDRFSGSYISMLKRFLKVFLKSLHCYFKIREIPYLKTKRILYDWAATNIKHSAIIFNSKNIKDSNKYYEIFIAGSDQIWTDAYSSDYLLDFVNSDNIKISYAASIGRASVSEPAKQRFKKSLMNYKKISIREFASAELIQNITGYKTNWCVDPTLLLSREEWDDICSNRLINDDYIFCYFLGNDSRIREIAKQTARSMNLKIVSIPFLQQQYNENDNFFGDYSLSSASPADFISLIKHAKFVMTDSFHACVFSNIYNKEYYVFDRVDHPEMKVRMYSYLELFNANSRFIEEDNFNADYIISLGKLNYSLERNKLENLIHYSKNFINEINNI